MPSQETQKFSVLERILAYSSITIIVVAVVSYLSTLVVGLSGDRKLLAEGFWPVVAWIAMFGLPIGFLLLVILLGISFAKRGRSGRKDRE